MKSKAEDNKDFLKLFFLFIIITILIKVVLNPALSLNSAKDGILIWLNILLPSLLPFFIISEILIGFGFVDFIGKLLKPLMKPLFNVPGEGAFPIAMSMLSGYPVGAKLTSRLREKKLITKAEGNRLICFSSTSGPLFMLGAVSIGMLGDSKLIPLIIIPHYLSILVIGLFIGSINSKDRSIKIENKERNLWQEIQNTYLSWLKTKKSIGSLITNSVKESMDSILIIGGLVIFYSVLVETLFNINLVQKFFINISNLLSIDSQLLKGVIVGFFEMTTGCKNIAEANINLMYKILAINFVIGWSGISVHSQALSFINTTDLNGKLYIISKFFHGLLSSVFGFILYTLKYKDYIQPTFFNNIQLYSEFNLLNWISLVFNSAKLVLMLNLYILLLSIFIYLLFNGLKEKY
ncbi:MAG: sporulation integral membrane protein YlbJ [Tissierellia bacterium]|nr:sporulation integral membrane protein YlbJ [Tissierellia bacterium]